MGVVHVRVRASVSVRLGVRACVVVVMTKFAWTHKIVILHRLL